MVLGGRRTQTPVRTEASRLANFTNERGVDHTIRYLRNTGGLWLLSECQRTWTGEGLPLSLAELPDEPVTIVRCILDSLAAGYARTINPAPIGHRRPFMPVRQRVPRLCAEPP